MTDNHKRVSSAVPNGELCDVLVIGAGPAGALAAYLLARRGLNVVLVDKAVFPRHKVCGCCLSPSALQALRLAGLEKMLDESLAKPITELRLFFGGKSLRFPLRDFRSISRKELDSAIVEYATMNGASFLPGHTASIIRKGKHDLAGVRIRKNSTDDEIAHQSEWIMQAKAVIVADGLGGTSAQEIPELKWIVRSDSYIGVGAISAAAPQFYRDGTIYMNYGKGGYLGLVRLEDGSTDIAAAISPEYLQINNGNVYESAANLINECGAPLPADLDSIAWKGTLPLTRRRTQVAAQRIFVIGDSASYVEPFTGEGIAWALQSACAVVPVVLQAVSLWQPKLIFRWQREYKKLIEQRQSKTKLVTELLRHSEISVAAATILSLPFATRMLANVIFTPDPVVEQELCPLP